MAIQFLCPSCNQPIEVDDEIGGKSAACPYCQRVVVVPTESTFQTEQLARARPLGQAGPSPGAGQTPPLPPGNSYPGGAEYRVPPPPPLHVGPDPNAAHAAAVHGNRGLICSGIAVVFFIGLFITAFWTVMPLIRNSSMKQHSPAEIANTMAQSGLTPVLLALELGTGLFSILGMAFGLASLRRRLSGNWRGAAAAVIGALLLGCGCLSRIASPFMV